MIEQLQEQNILTPLDLYFADLHKPADESQRLFLATLMAASRSGHLCLDLDNLDPLWDPEWRSQVKIGSSISSPYICRYQNLFYLEKNFTYETRLLQQIRELSFVKPLDFQLSDELTSEQKEALQVTLTHTLSIIEGGPGTGKTFLTAHLVKALGPKARVILAAPTGKAAARLKTFNPEATCGTLHSILGIQSDRHLHRSGSFIEADLIIVDESSMIDARLFAFFLSSIQKGQRVVFLGDGNQLPPVESGSFFGDLVDLLPTAHLKTCLRTDRQEICELAKDILAGKTIEPDFPLSEQVIIDKALEGWCILSPLREGPYGVLELNRKILDQRLKSVKQGEEITVPILITRTDYEAQLYNGEMGVLHRTREKPLYAQFPTKKMEASALPPYELGYVLSVHKSQGSEFDNCLIATPPGSELFGKEVLYTAVTRAKKSVLIAGDKETIQKTIDHSSRRRSGIKDRYDIKS